jgi:hypothetical protein
MAKNGEFVIVTITEKDIERHAAGSGLDVADLKKNGKWKDFMTGVADRTRSDFNLSTASDDLDVIVSKAVDKISCEKGHVNVEECDDE